MNYRITTNDRYSRNSNSTVYRMPLKRVAAGFYQTADGAFSVCRAVYPCGEVVWYWEGSEGANDVYSSKTDAVDALCRHLLRA